jgi:hypothetical protein
MTFMLLRAGLPNSIVVAALAAMPIVTMTLSPHRAPDAPVQSVQTTVATQSQPSGNRAVAD